MSEIVNIVRTEQLKEYLNQNGVNPKLLSNPRFYEILELLIKIIPKSIPNDELENIINDILEISEDGNIKIKINPSSDIISCFYDEDKNKIGFERKELKDNVLLTQKREFDCNGIEHYQEKEEVQTALETLSELKDDKIKHIKSEVQKRYRDPKRPDILIEEYLKDRIVLKKKYWVLEKFIEFENLRISKETMKKLNFTEKDVYFFTESTSHYIIMEELIVPDYEEIVEEYERYNEKLNHTKRYEKGIRSLCLGEKTVGGD